MGNRAEVQLDGQRLNRVALRAGQIAFLPHAADDRVAPCERPVGIAARAVPRRRIDDAHEHRRLLHVQLRRQLVEKSPRSGLDPVSIAAVRNRIEVHRDDLLFRIVILEHDGRNPLLELGYDEFGTFRDRIVIDGRIARIQVLGQLLRDRTASPLPPVAQRERLDGHPGQRDEIDSRMGIEAHVLGRYQRGHQRGRKLVVIDVRPVLDKEAAYHLSVVGIDFGSQIAFRILEFLERGQFAERPQTSEQKQQEDQCDGRAQNDPEPPDGFRRLKPLEYLLFIHNDANLTEQRYDFNRYFQ